jgi:hypothetical protein
MRSQGHRSDNSRGGGANAYSARQKYVVYNGKFLKLLQINPFAPAYPCSLVSGVLVPVTGTPSQSPCIAWLKTITTNSYGGEVCFASFLARARM